MAKVCVNVVTMCIIPYRKQMDKRGLGRVMLHRSKVLDLPEHCSSPSEMGSKVLSHPCSEAVHLTKKYLPPRS